MTRAVDIEGRGVRVSGRSVGGGSAIPDTSMFNGVIYHWTATAGIGASDGSQTNGWVDQEANITAVDKGTPVYRSDQAGFEAVEYDAADSEGHNWDGDGDLPTGSSSELTMVGLIYPNSATENHFIGGWGDFANSEGFAIRLSNNGNYRLSLFNANDPSGGTYNAAEWTTVGVTRGTSDDWTVYGGGSQQATATSTEDLTADNETIGWTDIFPDYTDGYLAEVIVCNSDNPEQAFSEYNTNRLG